ncbi:MAG: rod shape-determining protein RodA [Deltaproteobacteria bacterium]|nr:rod shape-determining protein RodA [Deltaproteobacteria bacterium]MBI4373491.1 rod shape-determining protein RodA [Deltaproteobacteria bacterium]
MFEKSRRAHFHWSLLGVVIAIIFIGLLNLHSATYDVTRGEISHLLWSQLIWLMIGSVIGLVFLMPDYRFLVQLAYPAYAFSLLLLILVVFFGKTVAGNRSWLVAGPLTFQPAEFAKLTLIFVLARYLSDHLKEKGGYGFSDLLLPGLLSVVPLVLIIFGKDLGSAIFFFVVSTTLFLFVGIQKRVILSGIVFLLVSGGVAYQFVLSTHQKARVEAFVNPGSDPQGKGYHLLQSKITVGSGRLLGSGYLKGMHSKLLFLPEKHTDFIFPVLAEEWGFLGSATVLVLYILLLVFGLEVARKARDRFGFFLALGVTVLFFWQIVINLCGVLGLMPLTGVTLPLLSYGGSSLVTVLMGIGLLLNVSMRRFMF